MARTAVLLLLAMAAALLALGSCASAQDLLWGDTTVTDAQEHAGGNLTLDGNLTVVEGGSLKLRDLNITVNVTSARQYVVEVQPGGSMDLVGVTMAALEGTYLLVVEGALNVTDGVVSGLPVLEGTSDSDTGIMVQFGGSLVLRDTRVNNPNGLAIQVSQASAVEVHGGRLSGAWTVLRADGESDVFLNGTTVEAQKGASLLSATSPASIFAKDCVLSTLVPRGPDTSSVGFLVYGRQAYILAEGCTVRTPELCSVVEGILDVIGGAFEPEWKRSYPDVHSDEGSVVLEGPDVEDVEISGGEFGLANSVYVRGTVAGEVTMETYGPVPPLGTLGGEVELDHNYWVDFQLLNESGVATAGLDLRVITSGGDDVVDTVSGPGGWVRDVPVHSWTRRGDNFQYAPSHRIEFGGTDFQITNLQVFDNVTVVLWNRQDTRDLVLDTDSLTLSPSAPRENRTFQVVVDGETLVPVPWPASQSQIELYVDGELYERRNFQLGSTEDVEFQVSGLLRGTHLLEVVVDPSGNVEEKNEVGNNVVRTIIDIAPSSGGDLLDLYVEIRRIRDTSGNEGDTVLPGIIFVDYTVRASNARVWPRNVPIQLLVDDAEEELVRHDLLERDGEEFVHQGRFTINLPRGDYDIRVRVDPDDEIEEEFELNNQDSRSVTLDPDTGDDFFLDPTCCSAIMMLALILAMAALSLYTQRKRREAAGVNPKETVTYPQARTRPYDGEGPLQDYAAPRPSSTSTPYPSPRQVPYPGGRPPQRTQATEDRLPKDIGERWTTERIDREMGSVYSVGGRGAAGTERVVMTRPKASPRRERFEMTSTACPRCQRGDVLGFSDGSAKCRSCGKIFYPGRGNR